MDARELKNYIYENRYVEQVLESIGCHHIRYHSTNGYWTCANSDGNNTGAVVLYDNEALLCINYTRQMIESARQTDIIDLICYTKQITFIEALKELCEIVGISYYHDFEVDLPESLKILKMLDDMNSNYQIEDDRPLLPISERILSYYKPYVNDVFFEDNIDYSTQRDFEIGYDEESNRYTIPIRSEIGDLVGVKARYFFGDVPTEENKYIYLEPCSKSRVLYGLHKTLPYIKRLGRVYVFESEKAVLQCWSMGFRNVVATGGKTISRYQIDMLVRLGVDIVLCFDKDVEKGEIEIISNKFPDGVPIYYIYDQDGILTDHESPSDDPLNWHQLIANNIYKMK